MLANIDAAATTVAVTNSLNVNMTTMMPNVRSVTLMTDL